MRCTWCRYGTRSQCNTQGHFLLGAYSQPATIWMRVHSAATETETKAEMVTVHDGTYPHMCVGAWCGTAYVCFGSSNCVECRVHLFVGCAPVAKGVMHVHPCAHRNEQIYTHLDNLLIRKATDQPIRPPEGGVIH